MSSRELAENEFVAIVRSRGALAVGYGIVLFAVEYLAWAYQFESYPRGFDEIELSTALLALHVVWWWLVVRSLPHRYLPVLCVYLLVVVATGCVVDFDPKRLYLWGDPDTLLGQIWRGIVDILAIIWLLFMFCGLVFALPFGWASVTYATLCPSLGCFAFFRDSPGNIVRPRYFIATTLSIAAMALVAWWQGRKAAQSKMPASRIRDW